MALHLGTHLLVKGSTTHEYVIERLQRQTDRDGRTWITVEARTIAQRQYDRMVTGYRTWTGDYVSACVEAGSMEILREDTDSAEAPPLR